MEGNNAFYTIKGYSSEPSSILDYKIVREERVSFDGSYQIFYNSNSFIYRVHPQAGIIELSSSTAIHNLSYISVLVVVQISDLAYLSSSVDCKQKKKPKIKNFYSNYSKNLIFVGMVDFRFSLPHGPKLPELIGPPQRVENICEDVAPINSVVGALSSFDSGLSNKTLCYSISVNDYFRLDSSAGQQSQSGLIYLKRSLLFTAPSTVNLTACLYFCNQPAILATQYVVFNVLSANKMGPNLYPIVRKSIRFFVRFKLLLDSQNKTV
jgi:hypothetical protein